ncbi:MAG: hypothetical protein QHJ73_12180 [Armatimonadota bacterium]|nr:hypothetical protein [Armatimonadota bacterium]
MRDFDFDRYQAYQERLRRPRTARWYYLAVAAVLAGVLFAIARDLALQSQPRSEVPSLAGPAGPLPAGSEVRQFGGVEVTITPVPGGRRISAPGWGTFTVLGNADAWRVVDERGRPVKVPERARSVIEEILGR